MLILYFNNSFDWGAFWTAVGAIITASGIIVSLCIAIATRKQTSKDRHSDNVRQNSEFYLKQAKKYFIDAIKLLEKAKNSNIKWHQAIALLKNVDNSISRQITEQTHKNIYCLDYMNAGYAIIDIIINHIDDFRFFYGIHDYKTQQSVDLYIKSITKSLSDKCLRIAPESLSCLCRFIDKASRAKFDIDDKGTVLEKIFEQVYFQKNITDELLNYTEISEFTKGELKKILEYLSDYQQNQKTQVSSAK